MNNPMREPDRGDRPCPAINGHIKTADCGAQRGSKLACPATCRFFPFGTSREAYDLFLKMDTRWGAKVFDYLAARRGPAFLEGCLQQTTFGGDKEERVLGMSHALYFGMFYERDVTGLRLVDHWEEEGLPGLNNDERVMMRHSKQARATVVEVQKVLDDQHLRCIDLYQPGQPVFLVQDRSLSRCAFRFSRLLCWLSPLPHHARLSMGVVPIDHSHWPLWSEVMERRLADLRHADPAASMSDLLARQFLPAAQAVRQVAAEYYEHMIKSLDLYHCVGTYRLAVPVARILARLADRPDFDPVEPRAAVGGTLPLAQFDWLRLGESAELNQALPCANSSPENVGTVGKLQIFPDRLVLEALSRQKYDFARAKLEQLFGTALCFLRESIVDAARQHFGDRPRLDLSPDVRAVLERAAAKNPVALSLDTHRVAVGHEPTLTAQQLKVHQFDQNLRAFLDRPTTLLDGQTPRQAASNPSLRPGLIELVKRHLNSADKANREEQLQINADWILEALNLPELK
jgi:hypothetical protein